MAKGAMANAPGAALKVFGSGAGNAPVQSGNPFYTVPEKGWASIIGVLHGDAWHFYDQVVDGGNVIQEARQIL